jgi:hypothetical protein
MPRLGQPVEPAHAERVEAWWRGLDAVEVVPAPSRSRKDEAEVPVAVPWPLD